MIVAYEEAIRLLQERLNKLLQWAICLLHFNELPLRHVFSSLDCVSEWDVVKFKALPNQNFPILPNDVVEDLSTDQYYAYRICWSVVYGKVDTNLERLEVWEICHSRCLNLARRILHSYTSPTKPFAKLITMSQYCIQVYFSSWFQIKWKHYIMNGAKNLYAVIDRVRKFLNAEVQDTSFKVIQSNAFFAHP